MEFHGKIVDEGNRPDKKNRIVPHSINILGSSFIRNTTLVNRSHSLWKIFYKNIIYLHTLGGHTRWLVKNLKLVPARCEGVVTDEVLQGWLLQPAGAEGGATVGVLEDRVASWRTLWRKHWRHSQRDNIRTGFSPRLSVAIFKYCIRKAFCWPNVALWTSTLQLACVQQKHFKVNLKGDNTLTKLYGHLEPM